LFDGANPNTILITVKCLATAGEGVTVVFGSAIIKNKSREVAVVVQLPEINIQQTTQQTTENQLPKNRKKPLRHKKKQKIAVRVTLNFHPQGQANAFSSSGIQTLR
jgi:hypothetical protein